VVDKQARQIKQAGKPGHQENDMPRLDAEHGCAIGAV
jgi:hypothetical protein